MRTSRDIMAGFSKPEDVRDGMKGINQALELERQWYADAPRFADNQAVERAVGSGALVLVTYDDNVQPIRRFRNPELRDTYPPYLTPNGLQGLRALGRTWRLAANEVGVDPRIKLAATSFVRTDEYEEELIAAGKFAVRRSTHGSGNSFDIDYCGYSYWDAGLHREVVVSLRPPVEQLTIASAFERDLGVTRTDEPLRLGPEHFDERVPACLDFVVERLYGNNLLNFVLEMANTPNGVMHITPSPNSEGR